jgi:hypothetical protein
MEVILQKENKDLLLHINDLLLQVNFFLLSVIEGIREALLILKFRQKRD